MTEKTNPVNPNDREVVKDRDANPDPITGAPGSHPVGTGVGAAGAGAAATWAGATIGGAVGGPVGAVVGGVELQVKGNERLVPRVVSAAEAGGFNLVDLSISESTLETVFIGLTGKELRD